MSRRTAMTVFHALAGAVLIAALSACATPLRAPFTAAEQAAATPVGFVDVRFDGADLTGAQRLNDYLRLLRTERKAPIEVLSLSGGGAKGAYGAGVLYGWSESGARPVFDVVTGVSTGALAAPFAFLGRSHDEALRRAYTDGGSANLLDFEGLLAFFRPSLFNAGPLVNLVEGFIDDTLVAEVAREHAKGRRLMMATVNLDTQKLVIWNMGAIAAEGGARATRLFREVMVASASIPGIFPPVMIDVTANGRRFAEMHVDGSTASSFLAVPESMLLWTDAERTGIGANLHVLINGSIDAEFEVTRRATRPILERSFDTAAKATTRTELVAIAAFGQRNSVDLKISHVPQGTDASPLDFDQARMTALFELGRQQALQDTAWRSFASPGDAQAP